MVAATLFVARSLMAGQKQEVLSFGTTHQKIMRTFFGYVYQASAAGSDPKTLVGLDKSTTSQIKCRSNTVNLAQCILCSRGQQMDNCTTGLVQRKVQPVFVRTNLAVMHEIWGESQTRSSKGDSLVSMKLPRVTFIARSTQAKKPFEIILSSSAI
jgi:hypothetical protein